MVLRETLQLLVVLLQRDPGLQSSNVKKVMGLRTKLAHWPYSTTMRHCSMKMGQRPVANFILPLGLQFCCCVRTDTAETTRLGRFPRAPQHLGTCLPTFVCALHCKRQVVVSMDFGWQSWPRCCSALRLVIVKTPYCTSAHYCKQGAWPLATLPWFHGDVTHTHHRQTHLLCHACQE